MIVAGVVTKTDWLSPDFRPFPEIAYITGQWTKILRMPWIQFRHEVSLIAEKQNQTVKGIEWREPKIGELVIPVDDDDWLHPDAPGKLAWRAMRYPRIQCWNWQGWVLRETGLATTGNGYRCCASHAWLHASGREKWHKKHLHAEKGFADHPVTGWANSPDVLHIWNNTPGSTTTLLHRAVRPHGIPPIVERSIETHRELLRKMPDGIRWAGDAVAEQLELLLKL